MQLEALLRSVERYAPNLLERTAVLYKPTEATYFEAYERLRRSWSGLAWRLEADFAADSQTVIGSGEKTVFHTDDDLYFRPVDEVPLADDLACFSLRLGLNVNYCYPLDLREELHSPSIEDDIVSWSWREQAEGSFSYPLALNAHVFRTVDVRRWLAEARFRNPNELEVGLQNHLNELPSRMASFRHSCVVNVPVNLVNEVYPNRHAGSYSVAELNDRFLHGERLDLDAMDFSTVTACHQELDLAFTAAWVAEDGGSEGASREELVSAWLGAQRELKRLVQERNARLRELEHWISELEEARDYFRKRIDELQSELERDRRALAELSEAILSSRLARFGVALARRVRS
jgi:hypothetical protein